MPPFVRRGLIGTTGAFPAGRHPSMRKVSCGMNRKSITAGDIVESHCTKCRKIMNHTVVALAGEKIARVECNTCHGVHNFRGPKAPSPVSGKPAGNKRKPVGNSKRNPAAAEKAEWEALQTDWNPEKATPYAMDETYRVKDLLRHAIFGLGVVTRQAGPHKMEVLFSGGKKLLRCQ